MKTLLIFYEYQINIKAILRKQLNEIDNIFHL